MGYCVAKPMASGGLIQSFFKDSIPQLAKFYLLLVILAGTPVFLYSLYHSLFNPDLRWLYLAATAVLGSSFPVKFPLIKRKGQSLALSVSDVFVFSAILLFGPEVAVVIAVIEASVSSFRVRVRRLYKQLFNLAQLALVSFVVGHVFYRIVGTEAPLSPQYAGNLYELLLHLGLCGLLYFLLNTGIVAGAVALVSGQSVFDIWKDDFIWASIIHFAGASLAMVIFLYFHQIQFYAIAIAAPIILLIYHAYKINLGRIKQAQEHLQQVNELLDKKIEAEKALHRSKGELELRVQERTLELKNANYRLLQEIKERKQAEKALAAEKELMAVTLRSIGDGAITTDTQGRVFLLNKEAEHLTGWTQAEATGRPLPEIFKLIDGKTRQQCENPARKVLQSGTILNPTMKNTVIISRDGTERYISPTAAPILDQDGKMLGVVLVFRDITQRLKMEEEILKTQKLESVGVLAGGIAHDFNNLLSGILLKTQLAQRACTKGKDPGKYLGSIEEATQAAAGLTQQLLTFARGSAPVKKAASIEDVLRESAGFALRGSKSRCVFAISDDLWTAEIDQGQISQVVNNLVINAEQAMPEGGAILISARNLQVTPVQPEADLEEGFYVRVTVKDQGIGIAPEYLQRIFDPYFTTKARGHGLGLASTYSIIQRHGGHITVQSELGKGTVFNFYLPATEAPVLEHREKDDGPESGEGRILIMDDEEIIRDALTDLLQELGYASSLAADGLEALALYEEACRAGKPFDAVIMDLTIPGGMGGKEAIQKLRQFDPHVTAIVSSGYSSDPVMANYKDYGFDAVLVKPLGFTEIGSVLLSALRKKRLKLVPQRSREG